MKNIDKFAPLSTAEEKLLAPDTSRLTIGDGELPENPDETNSIRADLIRHLLLSPDAAIYDKGIRLRGAVITGSLDLQGCDCMRDLSLSHCVLSEPINLVNARLRGMHVSGSVLHGIAADNAQFSGSVYLRSGTRVEGEISLAGARITGDLQICGAELISPAQDAVFAPSLRVEGSVFLGNYPYADGITTLRSKGLLFFSSARVDHDFFLTNTDISLPDNPITSPMFGATEEHGRDMALSLARARIGGILYLQDNQISRGIVNLAGAEVGRLKDEPIGPGAAYPIRLDGFRYSDFSRHTDTGLKARLEWLARRPPDTPFTAQPYEQLANVLISIGHRNDARTVLMMKEQLQRAENRDLLPKSRVVARVLSSLSDKLLRWTIGYGYRPGRSVVVAVLLIIGLGLFFEQTWRAGDMTPNSAPVLVSQGWISATQTHPDNPGEFWATKGQAGQDWETFNALAYAADLAIPLVSLGQESAWAPSTSRSAWGQTGWWLRWFAKAIGWIVTALGAAAITGVIRKD